MPQCIQKEKITEEGEIDAKVVRSVLDEDESVFVDVVSKWFYDILDEIESKYPICKRNPRWFVGLPEANCSDGDIPLINNFDSISVLKNLRSRVRKADFSSEISYLRKEFLRIIDSRIEQISFRDTEEWKVSEEEVEEIESIPVCDEDRFKESREKREKNPLVEFASVINKYNKEELEFLSEVLRVRNYGFTSPHAVIVDTVRKSMGEKVRLSRLLNIQEDEIGKEVENIRNRINLMVDKMNPFILGYILCRLSFVAPVDRKNFEDLPLCAVAEESSLGVYINIRDNSVVGPDSASNYIVFASDETSLEITEENVPMSTIEERGHDSKEEFYNKALKDAESIFSHEFGHHLDTCFGICNPFARGRVEELIDDEMEGLYESIKHNCKDKYDTTKYMYKNSKEFFAFAFDMWVNNPEKLENKHEKVYNFFESNFSDEVSISDNS